MNLDLITKLKHCGINYVSWWIMCTVISTAKVTNEKIMLYTFICLEYLFYDSLKPKSNNFGFHSSTSIQFVAI